VVIVTGANARFFRSLQQLLLSLQRWNYCNCVVYDLGLTQPQRRDLLRRFEWIQLRALPPSPEHVADVAKYGWKPTVLAQMIELHKEPVLWLDSACVVIGTLQPVTDHLAKNGIWVPLAGRGSVRERSHPATVSALSMEVEIQEGRFRAGGVCAFDPCRQEVLELVKEWRALAWRPEILAPLGSNLRNHRYDQTLLTCLVARSKLDASDDEIDISSARPISYLRTRNKLSNLVPLTLDPLIRLYFWLRRSADVALWQSRS